MPTTLLAPSEGRLLVADHDRIKEPPQVASAFGIVFQDPSLDDEPTVGLDPQARNQVRELIQALCPNEGVAESFMTRCMEEAERIADHVAVIDHGPIVAEGTPGENREETGGRTPEDAFIALTGRAVRAADAPGAPAPSEPALSRERRKLQGITILSFYSPILSSGGASGRPGAAHSAAPSGTILHLCSILNRHISCPTHPGIKQVLALPGPQAASGRRREAPKNADGVGNTKTREDEGLASSNLTRL